MHIASHVTPATMATRRRRSSTVVPGAKRPVLRVIQEGEVLQLPTNDVCTYWPPNPAFDPKRVLLRRMFFINEDKQSTCLSVSNLHAIINPWWNSASFGGADPSPSFSPTIKWLLWRTVCLLHATPCASAGTVSSSSARVATFACTPPGVTDRPGCLWAPST